MAVKVKFTDRKLRQMAQYEHEVSVRRTGRSVPWVHLPGIEQRAQIEELRAQLENAPPKVLELVGGGYRVWDPKCRRTLGEFRTASAAHASLGASA